MSADIGGSRKDILRFDELKTFMKGSPGRWLVALFCTLLCLTHVASAAPPAITAQPTNQTVTVGGTATFSVTATGSARLNYQWKFVGTNLAEATNVSLTLTNVQLYQAGSYAVLVSDTQGSILSSNATLTVKNPTNASSCVSPPAGLVGWWPGDGNASDIAGTNNGILKGGAIATASGVVGSAFSFDGTNGFVQIPDSPVFHPTNLTVEAWVFFYSLDSASDSRLGHQYIVFKQNTQTGNFEGFGLGKDRLPYVNPNGDCFYFIVSSASGDSAEVDSVSTATTNVWYHLAGVRGSNYIQLYINGQFAGQATANFSQDYGTLPLYFGTSGESYWDGKLNGKLDEVSLYNRPLSSNEIAAIYEAGSAGKCKPLAELSLALYPGALAGLTFAGQTGQTYGIQCATHLGPPAAWIGLTNLTLTVPTNLWYDPQPATQGQRFYRLVNGAVSIP